VTATFGPSYSWAPANKKYSLYGQVLAGDAMGFHSIFPAATGSTTSSSCLAVKLGGGVNLVIAHRVAWRVIEADWLHTQISNSTENRQNSPYFGTGLVFSIL
jgi:hypothetical protein